MHLTGTVPWNDLYFGLRGDIGGQIAVGQKDHLGHAEALHHRHRIRRGATNIDLGLHIGGSVDIGHHRNAGVLGAKGANVCAGDRFGQGTSGARVRDQHSFMRAKQLRGFGHEMHAALNNNIGINERRLLGQIEAIAHHIGHAVINFRRLVIMCQNHRVTLFFQLIYGADIGRVYRPLNFRHDTAHFFIKRRCLAGHCGRIGQIRHGQLFQLR